MNLELKKEAGEGLAQRRGGAEKRKTIPSLRLCAKILFHFS
jgi:hypothetical protein